MKKYTVYKITCQIDGKIYIGKHETLNLDDGYMGSGKKLHRAFRKYGIENFIKEILHVFDNEDEMNAKEAELVSEEFCLREDTYNICPGGKGGWGYINQNEVERKIKNNKAMKNSMNSQIKKYGCYVSQLPENRLKVSLKFKKLYKMGLIKSVVTFKGKTHTEETKRKIGEKNSISQSGSGNSQFGTMWINNGIECKKIKKTELIPEGWNKGRKIKAC